MNKFLSRISVAVCLLLGAAFSHAQSGVTLTSPGAPSYENNLTWSAPVSNGSAGLVGCDTVNVCNYSIFRLTAASCPATLVGSSGWVKVGTTANSVLAYSDTTVAPLTEYSYVVEANLVSDSISSGPSNCITITTGALPLVPAAPVQSPATTLSIP